MKRSLLKQVIYEWKTNIWFILEMAIVCVAIWSLLFALYIEIGDYFKPRGFNPENVYTLKTKVVDPTGPYFIPTEDEKQVYEDAYELLRRIKNNPNVESAAFHANFMPYNYDYSGNRITIPLEGDTLYYLGNFRIGEPDIIKVIGVKSLTGKSQDQLVEILKRGEILISDNKLFSETYGDIKNIVGTYADFGEKKYKIGDLIENIRRTDYEARNDGTIVMPFNEEFRGFDLALKIKEGKVEAFKKDFKEDESLRRLRKVYLSDLQSLEKVGETLQQPIEVSIKIMIIMVIFLLISIFLGLMGSFWFKVQQRISEIAIRKTFGADRRDILKRILGEGMLLLSGGVLLASAAVYPFIKIITEQTGQQWYFFLIIEAIVVGLMALGVCLSLIHPAWKAMNIEPAIAVKEE